MVKYKQRNKNKNKETVWLLMLDFIQPFSDQLLMICSLVFTISLVPQVLFNYKNKICEITYKTSVSTAIFVAVITLVYISNGFWLSTLTGTTTMILWSIMAIQKYKYRK